MRLKSVLLSNLMKLRPVLVSRQLWFFFIAKARRAASAPMPTAAPGLSYLLHLQQGGWEDREGVLSLALILNTEKSKDFLL